MTKRFGKAYGTESEKWEEHVPTPTGKTCMYFRCGLPIEEDDDGFIQELVLTTRMEECDGEDGYIIHRDCYLFSVGAIRHECSFQRGQAEECDFEWKHDKNRAPFARTA